MNRMWLNSSAIPDVWSGRILMMSLTLAVLVTGCQPQAGDTDDDADEPAALASVRGQEFLINGFQDEQGLKSSIEHHLEANPIAAGLDEAVLDTVNVDIQAIRDFAELAGLSQIDIYRVEFLPGFTGGDTPDPPGLSAGGDELESDGGLIPGFPSRESLAGQDGGWYTYERSNTRDGSRTYLEFPDGSSYERTQAEGTGGETKTSVITRDSEGRTEYTLIVTQDDEGNSSEYERQTTEEPKGRAEEWRRENQGTENDGSGSEGDGGDGDAGDDGDGDADTDSGDGELDQFQPSDDAGGTFCPLVIDMCRRALEDMVESREDILTGMIRVNPGDPDDQPEGSRFVYDPEDLVINPAVAETNREAPMDARRIYLELPVLVLPPRPGNE